MNGSMKQAVMTGIRQMELTEAPIPRIADDEVLVKIAYVGICGSDLHYYDQGRIGDFVVEPPFVLGHEASGIVVEVGGKVADVAVGDQVALEPGIPCGKCSYCLQGKYNLCPDVVFYATPPVNGIFQEYTAHKATMCHKLPTAGMNLMAGALIEPLAVGLYAAQRGGAQVGQRALVAGAGCIGLVSLLALKAIGITEICVTDILDNRLGLARELGASCTVNGRDVDACRALMEWTGGAGCDLAVDTTGSQQVLATAIEAVRKGANIVLVGYSETGMMDLPISVALNKELTFRSVFRYRHVFPAAISLVSQGKIDLQKIVTHVFDFDSIQEAMTKSIEKKDQIIKAVVKVSQD